MSSRERIRVYCDARHCKAEAFHPAKGWSHESGNLDFCRQHTAERAARFICPPDHKHGAVGTCYVIHKCRCDDCREHVRAREERRKRAHLYGTYDSGLVDAAPAKAHIDRLRRAGMGWKRIAEVSGVGNTAISQLIYGRKGSNRDPRKGEVVKRITREKEAAILAVRPTPATLLPRALVPALGTHRRIQALACIGWSMQRTADGLGMGLSNFRLLLERDRIENATALRVARLYRERWNQVPPARSARDAATIKRVRALSASKGWVPPLGWDDIDLEPATARERREAAARLHADGLSTGEIADRIGVNRSTARAYLRDAA